MCLNSYEKQELILYFDVLIYLNEDINRYLQ